MRSRVSPARSGAEPRRRSQPRRRPHPDAGSAIVDFALVAGLVTLVFAAVIQLTLAVHVRNTLVDCAAEGARVAALADRSPEDGAARTRALIGLSLAPGFADDVTVVETTIDGLAVVEVRVRAPLPVAGLFGPAGRLTVTGHALREAP